MPGFILDNTAVVQCMHGGVCQMLLPATSVLLGGVPALLQTSQIAIAGCTYVPPANGPDVTGVWMSVALKVTSKGIPVLLVDSQAVCAPSGLGVLVQPSQIKVKAI